MYNMGAKLTKFSEMQGEGTV